MPTPKKPAFKPRRRDKGPAARGVLGRIRKRNRNRFGVGGSEGVMARVRGYVTHFNRTGSITIPSSSSIGIQLCAALKIRTKDIIEVSVKGFRVTPKNKGKIILRVTSGELEGPRYFAINSGHKSGLFDRIIREYGIR